MMMDEQRVARHVETVLATIKPFFLQHVSAGVDGIHHFNYTGVAAEIKETFKKQWLPAGGAAKITHQHALINLGDSNNTDLQSKACNDEFERMKDVKHVVDGYTNDKISQVIDDAIRALEIRYENGARVEKFQQLKAVYKSNPSLELTEMIKAILYGIFDEEWIKNDWARWGERGLMLEMGYQYSDENDSSKTDGFVKQRMTARLNDKRKQFNLKVTDSNVPIKKRKSTSDGDGNEAERKLARLEAQLMKQHAGVRDTENAIVVLRASMNSTGVLPLSVAAMPQTAAAVPNSAVARIPDHFDEMSMSQEFHALDAGMVADIVDLIAQGLYVDNANAKQAPTADASQKRTPITTDDDVDSEPETSPPVKTNSVRKKGAASKKKATASVSKTKGKLGVSKDKATPSVSKDKRGSSKSTQKPASRPETNRHPPPQPASKVTANSCHGEFNSLVLKEQDSAYLTTKYLDSQMHPVRGCSGCNTSFENLKSVTAYYCKKAYDPLNPCKHALCPTCYEKEGAKQSGETGKRRGRASKRVLIDGEWINATGT